jgi:chromosomal replication initiation ATPase DnaA
LATCQWIREKHTLLIPGPRGVGKTHLAIGLGMRAAELGFGVFFHRLEDLLTAHRRDADSQTRRLRRKNYLSHSLVISDEETTFVTRSRGHAATRLHALPHRPSSHRQQLHPYRSTLSRAVAVSTHINPNATMAHIIRRAFALTYATPAYVNA